MNDRTEEVEIMKARIENVKSQIHKEPSNGHELWVDGLLCAFEFIRPRGKGNYTKSGSKMHPIKHTRSQELENQNQQLAACDNGPVERGEGAYNHGQEPDEINQQSAACQYALLEDSEGTDDYVLRSSQAIRNIWDNHWVPIGWERISELVRSVQVDQNRFTRTVDMNDEDEDLTVADIAAPYWEKPAGPTWWCHVIPTHPNADSWLRNAQWLHPAISTALRDEGRLISERMKHLYYEVPVRVAGGLLFELLGQSVGDPFSYEDDIPVVLRSWQAQNFLLTALHVKGVSSHINVLGITEVQDLLLAGGTKSPKSAHELIACLASRLTRWDDRLFRKYIFGASDEVELKFVNRYGVTPFTPMKGIFIQGPVFISFYLAISNMVEKVPSFKGGGAFWFVDLTAPDALYIFPVMTALSFLLTVEMNLQEGMEGNPVAGTMKNFSRILAVATVPFTMNFPKAIFCYWITSNLFSLCYGLVIKRPPVKKFLGLPEMVPRGPPPNFSIFSQPKSEPSAASVLPTQPPKISEKRVSSSSVISQRLRNLERTVKGRKKKKKI